MKAADVVARARGAIGHGCVYALGKGGMHPASPTPWPTGLPNVGCDCSGFVAWCLGVSRMLTKDHPHYEFGGWFETSAIARDARSEFGFVNEVLWSLALPGDLLVWGDHDGHQGHVGIVSECDETGPVRVIHCSRGNWRDHGDAIAETGVEVFRRNNAIAAEVAWVERSPQA